MFLGLGASSFDRLYRRHAADVYRYVYAVLGNHADAEDVTQQTFMNAYRAMAQGTKPRKAENWLLTIAHNEVRRHFRRTRGRPMEVELDEQLLDPVPDADEPGLAEVLRALQHLPPMQRAALVMREFEGRSYAEIAEILEVTQHALEGLIFRARRSLAVHMEGALTCAEAEDALLRRLDRRLRRHESRRLKEHLRECPACVRFSTVQKRQRTALRGLSILPIPASLYLFRGEQAALAATGVGGATAAGGSVVFGGGGAAAVGGLGLAAKAAAVAASVAVVGGVGYGVTSGSATAAKADRKAAHRAAVDQTRRGQRAIDVHAALARGERPGPAAPSRANAQRKASKQKLRGASKGRKHLGKKPAGGLALGRAKLRPAKDTGRRAEKASTRATAEPRERKGSERGRPTSKRPRPARSRAAAAAARKQARLADSLARSADRAKGAK